MSTSKKDIILIVDDIEINRIILREILGDEYDIIEAGSGDEAYRVLYKEDGIAPADTLPTVVLLDIKMPGIDGFEVLETIKNNKHTTHIPVLFITAEDDDKTESRGLIAGAADYITKPFNSDIVKARVINFVNLSRYSNQLEELVIEKTAEVTKTYESTLEVLATIIEYRNLESGLHIRRTTLLTEALITAMLETEKYRNLLQNENIPSLIKASALHDIGKIGIPDNVLLKPGKLTPEEFDIVKTHTSIGNSIVKSISERLPDDDQYLKYSGEICHHHHERWDGKGYPTGLKGEEIPISARILSVVDVYDALVSPRCYKPPFSHQASLDIISEGRGTQFDPHLVDLIIENADQFKAIEEKYGD